MSSSSQEKEKDEQEGELLFQGAESRVYLTLFCGKRAVIKQRLSKSYRVPALDKKINKQRLQQEVRCMVKCRRAGVCTPLVYFVDQPSYKITLEYIDGLTVKQFLLDRCKYCMLLFFFEYLLNICYFDVCSEWICTD